ncbi:MAG: hypothetical protein ACMG6S_12105 [Byssovorax sp.]
MPANVGREPPEKVTMDEVPGFDAIPITHQLGSVHVTRLVTPLDEDEVRAVVRALAARGAHARPSGIAAWTPKRDIAFIQSHTLESYPMRPPYTSVGYKAWSFALNQMATFRWRRRADLALGLTPFGKSIAHGKSIDFEVNPNYVKLKFDDWRNRLFAWDFAESELARPRAARRAPRSLRPGARPRDHHGRDVAHGGGAACDVRSPAHRLGRHASLARDRDRCLDRPRDQDRLEREWAAIALSLGGRPHIQKGDFVPEDFQSAFGADRIEAYRRVVHDLDPAGTFAHPQLTRLLGLAYPRAGGGGAAPAAG